VGGLRWLFDDLKGVKIVLPQAPKRYSKWYGFNTPLWYQYKIGSSGDKPDDADLASLDESAERLVEVVKAEIKKVGDPQRVWLGGNSQGGPMAFHALMHKRMPKIGGFIAASGTIEACTQPDKAKSSMPIHFYIPAKDDVYPKGRTMKRTQDFRNAGFTNMKNFVVPKRVHGSNKLTHKGITEFAEKLQKKLGPMEARGARSVDPK
jgi:predicted esterase